MKKNKKLLLIPVILLCIILCLTFNIRLKEETIWFLLKLVVFSIGITLFLLVVSEIVAVAVSSRTERKEEKDNASQEK